MSNPHEGSSEVERPLIGRLLSYPRDPTVDDETDRKRRAAIFRTLSDRLTPEKEQRVLNGEASVDEVVLEYGRGRVD